MHVKYVKRQQILKGLVFLWSVSDTLLASCLKQAIFFEMVEKMAFPGIFPAIYRKRARSAKCPSKLHNSHNGVILKLLS